ncbi:MAG: hypothetical protein ABJA86_00840 [Nocardioidaceae bacterium]
MGTIGSAIALLVGAILATIVLLVTVNIINGSPEQSNDPLIVYGDNN